MFLLTTSNVARYLIRTGVVVHPEQWTWRITSGPGNRSSVAFVIELSRLDQGNKRWFVKQSLYPLHYETVGADTEAQTYALLGREADLLPYLALSDSDFPFRYDAPNRILVLNGLPGFSPVPASLHDPQTGTDLRRGDFAAAAAAMMARFHRRLERRCLSGSGRHERTAFVANVPALLRNGAEALRVLQEYGYAQSLFRHLQNFFFDPEIAPLLQDLDQSWQFSHLIHGDAALRNFLYRKTDRIELRWVDWETAGWGDPRWDCALFFLDFILAYFGGYVNKTTFRLNSRKFYTQYFAGQPEGVSFENWFVPTLRLAVLKGFSHLIHGVTDEVLALSEYPRKEAAQLKGIAQLRPLFLDPLSFFDF